MLKFNTIKAYQPLSNLPINSNHLQQVGVTSNHFNPPDLGSRLTAGSRLVVGFSKLGTAPECHRLQEDRLYLPSVPGSHQHAGMQKVMGIGADRPGV